MVGTTLSTAKAAAIERSVQIVTTSANLMRLLRESSHSEIIAHLPKDLAAMVPNIKSTGKLLEQMPAVIVDLDVHLDDAIRSAVQLEKINSLFSTDDESESRNFSSPSQQQE